MRKCWGAQVLPPSSSAVYLLATWHAIKNQQPVSLRLISYCTMVKDVTGNTPHTYIPEHTYINSGVPYVAYVIRSTYGVAYHPLGVNSLWMISTTRRVPSLETRICGTISANAFWCRCFGCAQCVPYSRNKVIN